MLIKGQGDIEGNPLSIGTMEIPKDQASEEQMGGKKMWSQKWPPAYPPDIKFQFLSLFLHIVPSF